MCTYTTYMLLSHEEHNTVLPSVSIKHEDNAWKTEGRFTGHRAGEFYIKAHRQRGNPAGYHVGEGNAPLEFPQLFRKHFKCRVWNKKKHKVHRTKTHLKFNFNLLLKKEVCLLEWGYPLLTDNMLYWSIFIPRPWEVEKIEAPSRVTAMPVTHLDIQKAELVTASG